MVQIPFRGRVRMADADWVNRVYVTQYKEPFYKGGRTKERVPSWTDRILYHVMPSRTGRIVPEPMPTPPGAPEVCRARSASAVAPVALSV